MHRLIIFIFFIQWALADCIAAKYSYSEDLRDSVYILLEKGDVFNKDTTYAFFYLNRAVEISQVLNDNFLLELSLGKKGVIYHRNKDHENAREFYERAINIGKLSQKNRIHEWLAYMSVLAQLSDNYNLAFKLLMDAEQQAVIENDEFILFFIYMNRTTCYLNLNLTELAEQTLEKTYKYFDHPKVERYKNSIYFLSGDIFIKAGKYKKAREQYLKSLQHLNSIKTKSFFKIVEYKSYNYKQLGTIERKIKNYNKALDYFKIAFDVANAEDESESQKFSVIHRVHQMAIRSEIPFWKIPENMSFRNINVNKLNLNDQTIWHRGMGDIFELNNKPDSAFIYYKKAFALLQECFNSHNVADLRVSEGYGRKIYFKHIADYYKNLYMENRTYPGYLDSVYKYLNDSHARSLYEIVNVEDEYYLKSPFIEVSNQLQSFNRQVRRGLNNEDNYDINLQSLRYDLVSAKLHNDKKVLIGNRTTSLQQFTEYLKKTNSSALIYEIYEDQNYVFYMDEDTTEIFELNFHKDDLEKDIKELFKNAFNDGAYESSYFDTEIAYRLYVNLWKPVEKKVNIRKNVIIIPDYSIYNFPFDILLSHADSVKNYSIYDKPHYIKNLLVNRHNFSILPSAHLTAMFDKKLKNDKMAIFANSVYSDLPADRERIGLLKFNPLIFSKLEAYNILNIAPNTVLFEKESATQKQFFKNASDANIIHFATHSFVDTVFDMFSGIALSLSADSLDDGLLMGFEIENTKLNCDLVTLSACESGQGSKLMVEGVMGLPRYFIGAGSRSVIMTLWNVDDKTSSELMPQFYHNLLTLKLSKTEALGNAKRYLIESFAEPEHGIYSSNPFFWASFCLYGDIINNSSDRLNESRFPVYSVLTILLVFSVIIFIRKKKF
jgi:CHAT domain-containing protein